MERICHVYMTPFARYSYHYYDIFAFVLALIIQYFILYKIYVFLCYANFCVYYTTDIHFYFNILRMYQFDNIAYIYNSLHYVDLSQEGRDARMYFFLINVCYSCFRD